MERSMFDDEYVLLPVSPLTVWPDGWVPLSWSGDGHGCLDDDYLDLGVPHWEHFPTMIKRLLDAASVECSNHQIPVELWFSPDTVPICDEVIVFAPTAGNPSWSAMLTTPDRERCQAPIEHLGWRHRGPHERLGHPEYSHLERDWPPGTPTIEVALAVNLALIAAFSDLLALSWTALAVAIGQVADEPRSRSIAGCTTPVANRGGFQHDQRLI